MVIKVHTVLETVISDDILTTPCDIESVRVQGSRTLQLHGLDVARLNGHPANSIVLLDQPEDDLDGQP